MDDLLSAAERVSGTKRHEFFNNTKRRAAVEIKEAIIVLRREHEISNLEIARALGLDPSTVTRRIDRASSRRTLNAALVKLRRVLRRPKD